MNRGGEGRGRGGAVVRAGEEPWEDEEGAGARKEGAGTPGEGVSVKERRETEEGMSVGARRETQEEGLGG